MANNYEAALPSYDMENLKEALSRLLGGAALRRLVALAEKKDNSKEPQEKDPHAGPPSEWSGVRDHNPETCTHLRCSACARRRGDP
jgi:hypothetical protein